MRVFRKDQELFPSPVFHFDRKKYKDQLDKQVELQKLEKQLSKARNRLMENALLNADKRQANLNQTLKNNNLGNLKATFYGKV